ncbi:hypothetical protein [Ralstonia solanacearum]|uniref:hypothetical protein n=1 Tax=Ralstonia solanacearum TaxID=305 RepID=UPI0018D0A89F
MSLIRRRHAHPTVPAGESSTSSTTNSPAPEGAPRLQRRAGGSLQRLSEIQSAPLSSRPTVTAPPSGTDGSTSVHRSLRDYLAEDQESHQGSGSSAPTGGTLQASGKSGLAKLTRKVKKLVGKAKNAAERNFVSSQTSVLGVHTETTVGKPVKMSATKPRPEVLQSRPVPAGTRSEDLPGVPDLKAPQTAARQRKIDATAKAAFNPPASIAESIRGHLGLGQTKVTPQSVSIAEAMSSQAGMQVHLARLMGQPVHAPAVRTLHRALLDSLPQGAEPVSARPFAQHVLVAEALANACGGDAVRATAALRALKAGAFLPTSHAEGETASPGPGNAGANASRIARMAPDGPGVRRTGNAGADALHAAPQPAAEDAMLDAAQALAGIGDVGMQALLVLMPPLKPAKHEPLECVLQAAEQVTMETKGAQVRLPDIIGHAEKVAGTRDDTLACKVLRAEVKALRAPDTYDALSRADKSAVFAWRQGFRTDDRHSLLSQTQQRLAKFRKYVSRAETRDKLDRMRHDPSQSTAATVRLVANNVQRAFSHKKSPLLGMGRYGALGAGTRHVPTDLLELDKHLRTAIDELKGHVAARSGEAQFSIGRHGEVPIVTLRAAILEHWSAASADQRPQGYTLDGNAVVDIAEGIRRATGKSVVGADGRLPVQLEQLIGTRLSHATLKEWASDAAMPQRTETGEETAFSSAMRRARNILRPDQDKPADMTADSMRDYLKNFMADHNIGNSMTFADGGALGVNTSALTLNLARIVKRFKGGFALTPVFDAQASVARSAVFSIGTTAHGCDIFIGRQRQIGGQLGGGLTAGYTTPTVADENNFSASVGVSANVTLFGLEHTNPVGVRLRFSTQRKEDGSGMNSDAMRKQMSDMIDYMFDACGPAKRHLSPAQLWEDFAVHHFDQKNLSVGWADYSSLNSKMGGSVTLTARAGVTTEDGQAIRAGGSIGYGVTWNPFTMGSRKEKSGTAPILREDRGSAHIQTLTATASGQLPAVPLPVEPDGAANSLGVPAVPVASATYMLGNGGFNANIRTLVERGRLSEAFTYRDLSERNIDDFLKFANDPARRKEWEAVCGAEQGAYAEHGAGPDLGKKRLDDFLNKIQEMARPNQAHYMRWRLGEQERLAMDDYMAAARMAERCGRGKDAKAYQQAAEQIAAKEESWRPAALFTMHGTSKQTDTGLNFGLQATARTTATGDRELMFIGLPLPISDAWTKAARSGPAADGS